MEDYYEDNLDDIAHNIFSKPPGAANSIQLQLEEITANQAEQAGAADFIFNILYLLTYKGMQILYGHQSMHSLTEPEYGNLNRYVNSYGYQLRVYANESTESPWELLRQGFQLRNYRIAFEPFL
jgi:hypothetical protein